MWNLPPGFMSAMCGTRAAMRLKSASSSATPASLAMASRCSTALVDPPSALASAIAFSNACLVRMSRGRIPSRSISTTAAPAAVGVVVAAAIDRRWRRRAGQRQPERLTDRAHRVGGEHAAARAFARARVLLDRVQLVLGDRAGGAGADRLEHARDVERLAVQVAGERRSVVDEHAWQVQAGDRHHHPRHRLVAAAGGDETVEPLGVHHGLDRVGDDLAADERRPHPLVAHRDSVGHGDRAELERYPTRPADALLGGRGQAAQRGVARGDLVPRRGDADLRLAPVVVGEPDGPQHRPRGRLLDPVGDIA